MAEALEAGVVDAVVPQEQVLHTAYVEARKLAKIPADGRVLVWRDAVLFSTLTRALTRSWLTLCVCSRR